MGLLLAIFRVGAYLLVFGIFLIIGLLGNALFFMSRSILLKWIAYFSQYWARVTCWVLNIQIKVVGDLNIDSGSMIVANHVGSPDVFILGSYFKGFFVSKLEIATWPLFSWLARLGLTVFADRNKRHQVKSIIKEISERLRGNHHVILFPEGQATDGMDVVPFKSSIFEAVVQTSRCVIPVVIKYHDGNKPTIAFYGENFLSHIFKLLKVTRLEATVKVLPSIPAGLNRQELAEKSYQAINEEVKTQTS